MHTMYLRRCAKCGALRREPRFLGFVKTEVELVCKVNSLASETRNPWGYWKLQCPVRTTVDVAIQKLLIKRALQHIEPLSKRYVFAQRRLNSPSTRS
jgi:hypothetical protein